jgi:hypothetical protein
VERSPGVGAIGNDPAPPPGDRFKGGAVEVADDYVAAGSPRWPFGVARVLRLGISRARGGRIGGVMWLELHRKSPEVVLWRALE